MQYLEKSYWKRFNLWKDISEKDWKNWKWQIKNRIKTLSQLKELVNLPTDYIDTFLKVSKIFHFGTTPYYISLIKDLEDFNNPILKQILPVEDEIDENIQSLGSFDPFNEEILSPVKNITHRYPDRVLFRTTTFCSVYCRHCMRKRIFLGEERALRKDELENMFEYIRKNKEIREVLISGGDPLTLPNKKLDYILKNLYEIEHIDIIRIGSRELVVNPFRFFDDELLNIFDKYEKVWLVSHFNHPDEITDETKRAVKNILSTGTPVLNQTVLLKGVNDDKKIMENLMRDLLKVKIKPYYLFFCDPTKGVLHFRTSIEKGLEIMEHLRGRVSGLAYPIYAVDLPNGLGKVPVIPNYLVSKESNNIYIFRNYENKIVRVEI